MWKVDHKLTPENIENLFRIKERVYGEEGNKYHLPNIRLDITKRSILFQGPLIWNRLPLHIKNAKNLTALKRKMMQWLNS